MAKYDQGGGCACGLMRECDCASGLQADGTRIKNKMTRALGPSSYKSSITRQIEKLEAENKRLRKMLKNIQFVDGRCPVCQGWNVGPYGETDYVHTKKCPLAAELKDA